jgi:hypothetical protein
VARSGRLLHELSASVTQQNRRHVFERAQRRAGHRQKPQMQRGADPIARSKRLANAATVAFIECKPLAKLKFTEVLRKLMATNIGRLKCAHGGSPTGFSPAYEASPKTASPKKLSTGKRTKWHVWVNTLSLHDTNESEPSSRTNTACFRRRRETIVRCSSEFNEGDEGLVNRLDVSPVTWDPAPHERACVTVPPPRA